MYNFRSDREIGLIGMGVQGWELSAHFGSSEAGITRRIGNINSQCLNFVQVPGAQVDKMSKNIADFMLFEERFPSSEGYNETFEKLDLRFVHVAHDVQRRTPLCRRIAHHEIDTDAGTIEKVAAEIQRLLAIP